MNVLLRSVIWSLAVTLCVLPVVAVLNGWFANDRWPVRTLRVTAKFERVSEAALREAVQPLLAGGFFALPLADIRSRVAALDWVAEVEVRKQFPDRLDLVVHEHQPYARWGEDRLLSASGALFALPTSPLAESLVVFEADERQLNDVLRVYREAAALFAEHQLSLTRLRLSPRGSWSFQLSDGPLIMVGRGNPAARLRRFVPLLQPLRAAESRPLQRADLRYSNGFALRWGDPVEPTEPARQVPTAAVGMDA